VGAALLEKHLIGRNGIQLQLKFLHIRSGHRDRGLGKQLFDLARVEASQRGAEGLYISATPSEHTIDSYLRLGYRVTPEPNPELFELEPDYIHLEYDLRRERGAGDKLSLMSLRRCRLPGQAIHIWVAHRRRGSSPSPQYVDNCP